MFVISIKRLFDYSGNKLDTLEYEYFGYDRYGGSYSTGYPTWMRFRQAEIFKTAEQAKKVYMENLRILACDWSKYDRDSVKVCKIKCKPIEALPWKESEEYDN